MAAPTRAMELKVRYLPESFVMCPRRLVMDHG
jgi:hypothetical protein